MVQYNDGIGVLPREKRRNGNTFESRNEIGVLPQEMDRDSSNENREEEKVLKKQTKKPKITDEQFQQHLNADPALAAANEKYQAALAQESAATERVKNSGMASNIWGSITGNSGLHDLEKANTAQNEANQAFNDALDKNTGYSAELKAQLRRNKGLSSKATIEETSKVTDAHNAQLDTQIAVTEGVRNTAVGAAAITGAVILAPAVVAGGATILSVGGAASLGTFAGTAVGGAAVMGAMAGGTRMIVDEGGVVVDALKADTGTLGSNFTKIQNDRNQDIIQHGLDTTSLGMKVGATLPVALAAGPAATLGGVGKTLLTGAGLAATGAAVAGAYGGGREAAKITLDSVRNPDAEKGTFDTWKDNMQAGLPAIGEKTLEGAKIGAPIGLSLATPLGRPLIASLGTLGAAEGVKNVATNLEKSRHATGAERISLQNEAILSGVDATASGFGTRSVLKPKPVTTSGEAKVTPMESGNSSAKTSKANVDYRGSLPGDTSSTKTSGRQNKKRNTQQVAGTDLPPAGNISKKSDISNRTPPPQSRPEIEVSSLPNGDQRVRISGQDNAGNLRIRTDVSTPASPRPEGVLRGKRYPPDEGFPIPRSSSIEKHTPDGATSTLTQTDVMAPRLPSGFGKKYKYSKTGPDGTPVSTREYNPQSQSGSSTVMHPDGSTSKRTYKKNPDGSSLTSFEGSHEGRVTHKDTGGREIQYRIPTTGVGEVPKVYQKIKRPDGTTFHGAVSLPGGMERRVIMQPVPTSNAKTRAPLAPGLSGLRNLSKNNEVRNINPPSDTGPRFRPYLHGEDVHNVREDIIGDTKHTIIEGYKSPNMTEKGVLTPGFNHHSRQEVDLKTGEVYTESWKHHTDGRHRDTHTLEKPDGTVQKTIFKSGDPEGKRSSIAIASDKKGDLRYKYQRKAPNPDRKYWLDDIVPREETLTTRTGTFSKKPKIQEGANDSAPQSKPYLPNEGRVNLPLRLLLHPEALNAYLEQIPGTKKIMVNFGKSGEVSGEILTNTQDIPETPQLPEHLQKATTPPTKVEAPKSKRVPTDEEIEATILLEKRDSVPSKKS